MNSNSESGGPDVQSEALALLGYLASRYTSAMLVEILDILEGKSGAGMLIHDTSLFVTELVQSILGVIEPAAVRESLAAQFIAANAAGDAAIVAKFGTK